MEGTLYTIISNWYKENNILQIYLVVPHHYIFYLILKKKENEKYMKILYVPFDGT